MEATDFPALESTHLLLRREVVSSTLFDNISPDESGLRYIKPSHWKKLESELLEHPNWTGHPSITGICAGDFDGDSRPDIFMAYPYGGHRLYRNLGGFKFEDFTESSGIDKFTALHWAVGCSFVDYDGDRDLDLFVAGTGDVNLLLENLGNGTFRERAGRMGVAHKGQIFRWPLQIMILMVILMAIS